MGEGTIEHPFRTLEAARDRIRQCRQEKGMEKGNFSVVIRGGKYSFLNESFVLREEDSGTESCPVIYCAYEGERVIFDGSISIEGKNFHLVKDKAVLERLNEGVRDKVFAYDLKAGARVKQLGAMQKNGFGWPCGPGAISLLSEGVAQPLTRYPKEGFLMISSIQDSGFIPRLHQPNPDGSCPACTMEAKGERVACRYGEKGFLQQSGGIFTAEDAGLKERIRTWSQEADIWCGGYFCWDWADDNCPVMALEETERGAVISLAQPSRYGVSGRERKFYFYNLLSELSCPGEWYLDRESGMLYLCAERKPDRKTFALTVQTRPIVLMESVSNVQWQGIEFSGSNGYGIVIKNCEKVEIAGCRFRNLGQRAVFMGDPEGTDINQGNCGGRNNRIRACDIAHMGQGGVYIGGGNRYNLTPGNNKVMNCDIRDFAVSRRTYSPAIELAGCGNAAERNRIYDAPHTAIMFAGNDMLIAGNEIFDVCQETSDVGAIYSVRRWSGRGSVIRNNYIHDLDSKGDWGSAAIYMDDLTSGVTMTENLLVNISGYSALFGGGRDNIIANNIQLNHGNGRGIHYDDRGLNWAWRNAAGPDGECVGELEALRGNPLYQKEKWDERYPELAKMDLHACQERTEEGFRYYYVHAAQPDNAVIRNNILAGVANPFGNIVNGVKVRGTFEHNYECSEGEEIGFVNTACQDYSVKEECLIRAVMGDSFFKADKAGLYEDEYRRTGRHSLF